MTTQDSLPVSSHPTSPQIDEANLAPHACSNCKHGHRKCDRRLPTCGYCAEKRKACSFDEPPQKRGPKKREGREKSRYKPYNSPDGKRKDDANPEANGYQFFHFHQQVPSTSSQNVSTTNTIQTTTQQFNSTFQNTQQLQNTIQSFGSMQKNFNPPQYNSYGNGSDIVQNMPQPFNQYNNNTPTITVQDFQFNAYNSNKQLNSSPLNSIPQQPQQQQQFTTGTGLDNMHIPFTGLRNVPKSEPRYPSPTTTPFRLSPSQLNSQNFAQNSLSVNSEPTRSQTLPLPPLSALHQLPQAPPQLNPAALQSQFDFLYLNTPVVDRRRAESILKYINATQNGVPNATKFVPGSDDIALIYAQQSRFFKRYQQREQSTRTFQKSRELISSSFDRVLINFNLVATYAYLGIYLIEDDEAEIATFYMNNVENFMKKVEGRSIGKDLESNLQSVRYKYVNILMRTGLHYMGGSYDLAYLLKCFFISHFLSKEYRKLNDCMVVSDSQDSTSKILEMIHEDVDKGTNKFKIGEDIADKITKKCQFLFNTTEMRPEEDICNKLMMALIIAQGLKVQAQQRSGRSALETADYITALTGTATFNYCLYIVVQPVALAMMTHLQVIENGASDQPQLFDQLRKDMRAMTILCEKYKIAQSRFASLIARVESILKIHDEHKQLVGLYSSLKKENGDSKMSAVISPNEVNYNSLVGPAVNDGCSVSEEDLNTFLDEFLMHDAMASMTSTKRIAPSPTDEILFL